MDGTRLVNATKIEYEASYAMFRKCLFEVLEGQMDFPNLMPVELVAVLEENLPE
jgi:hypothetical protein